MASASVKPLLKALEVVPSQAVPATVNAFLIATATPHTHLFYGLVDEMSQLIKEPYTSEQVIEAKEDFATTLLMAIFHLFKLAGSGENLLPSVVWTVCVPLLQKSSVSMAASQSTVFQMLAEIFTNKNAWKYAQDSLLPYLLLPIELILSREKGTIDDSCLDKTQTEKILSSAFADEARPDFYKPLNFDIVCRVVAMLLTKASNDMDMKPLDDESCCKSLGESFWVDLVLRFFKPLLLVLSQIGNDTDRQCAVKVFLPPALRIIDKLKENMQQESVESLQRDLWNTLKLLFTKGCLQKQDAYAALDTSVNFLLFSFTKEQKHVEKGLQAFDLFSEMEFWDVVKSGLVEDDPLSRKRALHILKEASKAGSMCQSSISQNLMDWKGLKSDPMSPLTKRDTYAAKEARSLGLWDFQMELWKAFFLLYDMLEEYGTHLVEAAWNHQISLLLPALCGIDIMPEAFGEAHIKGKFRLQDLDASIWWITVLWERGFKHDNPQVRRLILQSYMKLEWTKITNLAIIIPKTFVLGPLLSTFNDPIHHKDFGKSYGIHGDSSLLPLSV